MNKERHTVSGCGTVGMEMEGGFFSIGRAALELQMEEGDMLKVGCEIVVGGIHLQSRKIKLARCSNGIVLRGGTSSLRF